MTEVLERGSSFVRDLGEAARENPVSAALIGMGVLWLFGGTAVAMSRSAATGCQLPTGCQIAIGCQIPPAAFRRP